jgi:hypothetical protein
MAIPSTITADLVAFNAQVSAAAPLRSAASATLKALKLNLDDLIENVATAQNKAAGGLDTWAAPADAQAIASGVLGLVTAATDQAALTDMLALLGRANLNLDQLTN